MKVCVLALEWPGVDGPTGGVGRFNYRLANALQRNHEVTVVVSRFDAVRPAPRINLLNLHSGNSRFSRYYVAPLRVRSALNEVDADVIISSGDDWACSCPNLIRIMHGTASGEAKASKGLRRVNHELLAVLERRSARQAARVFGVGPDSLAVRQDSVWFPPVVGIPVGGSDRVEREPLLLFVGSYLSRKRGYLAEKVWLELTRKGFPFRLVVIGPAADKPQWDQDVEHVSSQSDENVAAMFREARFLLSPSIYEGFGIATFEALSSGCIPLCARNPGSEYLLGDRLSRLLLGSSDTEYVAGAVESIMSFRDNRMLHMEMTCRATEIAKLGDPSRLLEARV